ncbi:MAG: GNAT family N-acetyltransferase [Defluviitaleaceae bacterium]|nr:GNAT family N-acetyltransferase [Defluviitaleaceae bacterium]
MSIIKTHDITLYGSTGEFDIVLRPLSDKHLPLLYKWNADPEVLYWSEGGTVDTNLSYDSDTVHAIFGGVSQNAFCFLIEANGIPIGECWLQKMNLPEVKVMYPASFDVRRMDFAIGEKSFWGKGIGTQFISMLIEFAFDSEQVDVLHCFSEDYNVRSCRIWEKHGFKRILEEALVPQPQKGQWQYHCGLQRRNLWNVTQATTLNTPNTGTGVAMMAPKSKSTGITTPSNTAKMYSSLCVH